jgi:hypothetical protein
MTERNGRNDGGISVMTRALARERVLVSASVKEEVSLSVGLTGAVTMPPPRMVVAAVAHRHRQ